MLNRNPKILLLVSSFPNYSETFITSKFLELLKLNPKIKLHCDKFNVTIYNRIFGPELRQKLKKNILISFASHRLTSIIPAIFYLISNPRIWIMLFKYKSISPTESISNRLKCIFFDLKILNFKPEIIHFEFATLLLQRYYLDQIVCSKLLISFRGYDANIFPLTRKCDFSILKKKVSNVHVLSQDLKKKIQAIPSFSTAKFYKIPPAVKITEPAPIQNKNRNFINILSVGRLEWKKGYEYLLGAANLLNKDNFNFKITIIGSGPYFEAISFAIHQFDLSNLITIKENIPFEQMHVYYDSADIFVHPSLTEGFCNAVLEAQSYGVPVVCTNVGGLPENISNGKTGYLVPPYNSRALYEKIRLLMDNPRKRIEFGLNGKIRAQRKFLLTIQTRKFAALYQAILNHG